MRKNVISAVIVIVMALTLAWLPRAALRPEESHELDGKQTKPFHLKSPNNQKIDYTRFEARPTVIGFFASWCPPCRAELTQWSRLHEKYGKQGLVVLAVAVDPLVTPDTVKGVGPLAAELKLPYAVALATDQFAKDYNYKGFPTTIIINADGKIARTFYGYQDLEKFEVVLQKVVGTNIKNSKSK
ncbi:MAG: TlpA family protein disulfide reductase [Acidobacteria bacterium]|nr:TlpA family protein disulfide reductase [Acidobacteriota bacterium]MBI3657044.1 TlpA family protein disulfide reductase [Acidobacteriota bacterium]